MHYTALGRHSSYTQTVLANPIAIPTLNDGRSQALGFRLEAKRVDQYESLEQTLRAPW